MANMKFYSDVSGEPVELKNPYGMDNKEYRAKWPDVKGRKYDGFSMWVGRPVDGGEVQPVTRYIEYRSNPSKHVCDSRCVNAQGKIMKCECSCGGKNHGKGAFTRLIG
ncbi:hypothetical protein [Paraburkholderia sp. GAS32]|uniref:hypothetical protein n=1 Tax=Paraburkholderia sp. GAS32 TaxID=3035129 RepID=UPI003D23BF64